jgi:hypothetical protein
MVTSGLERPAVETEEALRTVAAMTDSPLQSQARLTLAAVGGRVRASDPDRAVRIEEEIVAQHRTDMDPAELIAWLSCVSNVGARGVPEPVHAALSHGEEEVRAAAAHALLRVRGGEADEVLSYLSLAEDNGEAQRVAMKTLVLRDEMGLLDRSSMPGTVAEILVTIGQGTADPSLREYATSLLAELTDR